jgi:3',5'-cyclic AMP phosphodiesterase CpdA
MIVLQKNTKKDFIVLNLTDPQLDDNEWSDGHAHRKIVEHTITELIRRANPNLITVSGDLAWAGYEHAYGMFGQFLESFGIPWAVVWGNHDNQNGAEFIEKIVNHYQEFPHFVYEKGDPALGNGNYIIRIEENGKPVEAIFMMDTHDKDTYLDENGNEKQEWAKLTPEQVAWYTENATALKEQGFTDSTVIVHIPIYAYRLASKAAYKDDIDLNTLTVGQANGTECWNEGYTDSVGLQKEAISAPPIDEGMFSAIKDVGTTKHVIAGHDHVNNWMIRYEGVKLIYGLNVGPGCYWEPVLNGGTVLKINENGDYEATHEYVDGSML